MSLRASAKSFDFQPPSPPSSYEEEYDDGQEPFYLDGFIESVLANLTGYYIKGGKAYNYYFPQGYIQSADYDLVATNHVCDLLFQSIVQVLGNMDRPVYIEGYEPMYITAVNAPTQATYKDVSVVTGKTVKNTVRSLSLLAGDTEIAIVDVIVADEKSIAAESEQGENGLWYMRRDLFKKDLAMTYKSREKMVGYIHRTPPKQMTPDVIQKAASLEHKLQKSRHRYETSLHHGRKQKRRSMKRRLTKRRSTKRRSY